MSEPMVEIVFDPEMQFGEAFVEETSGEFRGIDRTAPPVAAGGVITALGFCFS
jgi:hypothetical protein